MAASLGYVLGRNWIPSAWAADDTVPQSGELKTGKQPYRVAKGQAKHVILLWMSGGPSHLDTFDPKPGTKQSGGVNGIQAADGLLISQKFPKLAQQGRHLCVLRGVTTKEGDHQQASYLMHTGYREQSGVQFPGLGSIVWAEAKEDPASDLPSYVAMNGSGAGPGFYGPAYGPFVVTPGDKIPDIASPVSNAKIDERLRLLNILDNQFAGRTGASLAGQHQQTNERAVRLSRSPMEKLFELKGDNSKQAARYGNSNFGKACYIAKHLIRDGGVRFVEIEQNGWDTHGNNHEATRQLCGSIDTPFAQLLEELAADGLLQSTLVLWMGEFGRTPDINSGGGRDHYPRCFSVCMAGGGVKGGQAVGSSNATGHEPVGEGITVPNLFYTICDACGIDATKVRDSAEGRPIQIVDRDAKPVPGIFN